MYSIGLVGLPNSGKSSLFNSLTGSKQKVANFPGITTEKKSGQRKVRTTCANKPHNDRNPMDCCEEGLYVSESLLNYLRCGYVTVLSQQIVMEERNQIRRRVQQLSNHCGMVC